MATLAREEDDRIVLANEPPFRLGALDVAPALRQVIWNESRTLEPRVMQVLVALAQAEGGIVGRDALIERCWDGRIVGENAINRVISLLRQLASETRAFEIETVTKVGYRLKVQGRAPALGRGPAGPQPLSGTGARIGRRAALGVVAAAVAGGPAYLLWSGRLSPRRREADRYYRAGIESDRRGDSSIRQTIAYYEQAARADPRYAPAWGALALALVASADSIDEAALEPVMERARLAARHALRYDSRNADALTAGVLAEPWFRNWAAVETSARNALAVRPELNLVRLKLALSLANTGRLRESLVLMRDLAVREPLVPTHVIRLAWLLWQTNQPGEARAMFDRAYAIWPGHMWVWTMREMFLSLTGETRDALAMTGREHAFTARLGPFPAAAAVVCARALAHGASASDQMRAVDAIKAARQAGDMASFISIPILPALGAVDTAFEHAYSYYFGKRDQLTGERQPLPRYADRWTDFLFSQSVAPMRADPRFQKLTAAIGLESYWRATGSLPDYRAG